ncbi:hypothetical protein V2W30_24560 [Streptomyces sp. Q6]|uniref:Uncharacterized protein n=1 Tax=Streptomyces citrinus TaxID=3118173 RepID=A0ACD5AG20_9ACTN
MADEHYKWLDREAAERLLRGEPLKAVVENSAHGGAAADEDLRQAERLAAALESLTALPSGPDGELPGEEAALKAFRESRAVPAVEGAVGGAADGAVDGRVVGAIGAVSDGSAAGSAVGSAGASGRHRRHRAGAPAGPSGPSGSAGPGRGPRWGRPVRFGLAAAVAACMVGGVAVAAGTGVLPSPFGGRDEPAPAASVSAAASPDKPLASPSPGVTGGDEARPEGSASPDDTSGSPDAGRGDDAHGGGPSASADPRATEGGSGEAVLRRQVIEACVKYRGGRLGSDERRLLRDSAKRSGRSTADLDRFCDRALGRSDSGSDANTDSSDGDSGSGNADGKSGGQDGGDEDDDHGRGGGADQNIGFKPPSAPTPTRSFSASPDLPTAGPSASVSTPASAAASSSAS